MKQKAFSLCCYLLLLFSQVSITDGCTYINIDIVSSKPGPISCNLATSFWTHIYWSISRPATKETRISTCYWCAQISPPCDCYTTNTDYRVTRTYINETRSYTTLHFVNNVRDNDESIIKCSDVDDTSCVEFTINVEDPVVPENIHVVVDSSLKVTGRADFVSSGDNVLCRWFYSSDSSTGEIVQGTTTLRNLSTFTDVSGLEYQRGSCNMTMQLNTSEITYYFHVEIQPGGGPQFADSVTIKKPGTTLTTTCPDYVLEGSDLTCECSHLTAQHGNPPATISWRNVTDTAVLHVHNVSSLLHVPSVHRNQNGTQFVCTSVWGAGTEEEARSTLTYTLLVADDGPEPFPWVVVGVAVGAAVLVVVIVIVIVVVASRRRGGKQEGPSTTGSHRESQTVDESPSGDYYLTPVSSHTTRHEDQLPYDSLQMSEVGLRSTYSDVRRHRNVSSASTAATPYEDLRRSDVGLASEYSVVGEHRTSN